MINIRKDNTSNKWYAATDKGVIYGGSERIVQNKINRIGAKEKVYKKR